jgi:hypothetical protein
VASAAFVLLSQTARQNRGTWVLAGTGMLALAVADSGFAYLTVHEAYSSASVIDPGWFIGFLLIALAGIRVYRAGVPTVPRHDTRLLVLLPYVPLAAAMVTSTVLQVVRGTLGTFLYVLLMFLVVCVVLRGQHSRELVATAHAGLVVPALQVVQGRGARPDTARTGVRYMTVM